jgi:arsenate reductase (thioredoxin)
MRKKMKEKKKILFLCTGNSCRSQMAEAWTRHLRNNNYEAFSASITPKEVDPSAIRAMEPYRRVRDEIKAFIMELP